MTDAAKLNTLWGIHIIDTLVIEGCCRFAMSPGSRSTPLVAGIAHQQKIQTTIHYDERALGYFALGFAKASRIPMPIVVTSGTAVANLMPAVCEANQAAVPMVILSADRSPEELFCGANQTMGQKNLFGEHVRNFLDLGCPEMGVDISLIREKIRDSFSRSQTPLPGPVHINCPFRKPLGPVDL